MRIVAVLTCFNRKESTLECLHRLFTQEVPDGIEIRAVLMDDGSTDGTGSAVKDAFPDVEVLSGDGSLYWCGGMRRAWKAAAADNPEYFLLLNDDTLLNSNALAELLDLVGPPDKDVIGVAAICDAVDGSPTYGGMRQDSGIPTPCGEAEQCDTFNANAVLVPREVYRRLGIFHDAYTHGMGDFDYGYLATRNGVSVMQSGTYLGTCSRNPEEGTWRDRSLTRRERWKLLHSVKGLPFKEWVAFNRRNAGWKWMVRSVSPSIRVILGW